MALKLELLGAGLPDAVQPLGAESGALQDLENELADADRVGFHRGHTRISWVFFSRAVLH